MNQPTTQDPFDYTKVTITADSRGRINIGCENAKGYGHGYRLAGPKNVLDHLPGAEPAKVLAECELDERDVEEIRSYLKIWDEIRARKDSVKQPKYVVGARIRFPLSGHVYNITAVDGDQVTFAFPGDPEDSTTEAIADLDAVDVEVLPADPVAALQSWGRSMAQAAQNIRANAALLGRRAEPGGEE